jgi:hypothetical protein
VKRKSIATLAAGLAFVVTTASVSAYNPQFERAGVASAAMHGRSAAVTSASPRQAKPRASAQQDAANGWRYSMACAQE